MLHRGGNLQPGLGLWGLLVLLLAGCGGQTQSNDDDEYGQLFQDEPLHFRLNSKSEVFLHNRWINVFNEQGTVRNYIRKQAERYQQFFDNEGVSVQAGAAGSKTKVVFPTEVVIEPEPTTKAGTVLCIQRLCKEYGFFRFTIKLPEQQEGTTPQGS